MGRAYKRTVFGEDFTEIFPTEDLEIPCGFDDEATLGPSYASQKPRGCRGLQAPDARRAGREGGSTLWGGRWRGLGRRREGTFPRRRSQDRCAGRSPSAVPSAARSVSTIVQLACIRSPHRGAWGCILLLILLP